MRTDDRAESAAESWALVEHAVEQLHAAARSGVGVREFSAQLLEKATDVLEAVGGAMWRVDSHGDLELIAQSGAAADGLVASDDRRAAVRITLRAGTPSVQTLSTNDNRSKLGASVDVVLAPVVDVAATGGGTMAACLELWLPAGASPAVRQGWIDFAAALADVAADFHAFESLRRLRGGDQLRRQAIDVLRRVGRPRDLKGAAYELANEGRRALDCDRLSVLVRRGGRLRLLATSGVDATVDRSDFTRRLEQLAAEVTKWGEPLEYRGLPPAASTDTEAISVEEAAELPPVLAAAIEQHLDHSQARELVCVPIAFPSADEKDSSATPHRKKRQTYDAVLVAEQFGGGAVELREQLVELGELCGPALARAAQLDRFPVRMLLGLSERTARLGALGAFLRPFAWLAGIGAVVAALVFIPCDYDVEAPATLHAKLEREVFASATGVVAELKVKHGQHVAAGDVLVVLDDQELSLKLQQVSGEMDAARKRLGALSVARTERTTREEAASPDRLPLSAEQQQLEQQLASLQRQRQLLESRKEALILRSPIEGTVLTRDVEMLLASRPVERGQALMTIADPSHGWEVIADVPQRKMGAILEAESETKKPLAASYRLAADVEQSFPGKVIETASAAALDAEGLRDEAPPVKVRIAAEQTPPTARPGMSATVRIHCGRKSLGYVFLHDAAATVYRWATF